MKLSDRAQQVWDELSADNKYTRVDSNILRVYCETVSDLEHAESQLENGGTLVIATNGEVRPSPWVNIVESRRRSLLQLSRALGMISVPKKGRW